MNFLDYGILDSNAKEAYEVMVNKFNSLSGRELKKASPESLIFLTVAYFMSLREEEYNDITKQNHLRFARGKRLDLLGELYGERGRRTEKQKAKATFRFHIISAKGKNIVVPKNSLIQYGDLFFETDNEYIIPIGKTFVDGLATCTVAGEIGNGIPKGSINTMVDLYPYYERVENISETNGGTDLENDEKYRERIRLVPDSFTVAGSSEAYKFWTKKVSPEIQDVTVVSPSPATVDVYALTENGVPSEELKQEIEKGLNDSYIRPLTDKVSIKNPTEISFNIDLDYYIEKRNEYALNEIKKRVESTIHEYKKIQKSKLGMDIVPDDIIQRLKEAGVKRIVIREPSFRKVSKTEYSVGGSTTLNYLGVEEE